MNLRRLSCAAAFGALCASHASIAEPVSFRLEPEHSFVHFEVLHFGTSTARGRFGPISGHVTVDRDTGSGSASIVVDTASVSTGLRVFDARIRRSDLLASDDFPQAVFSVDSFRFEGERLAEVGGTLSLRGVSRPLVLRALRFGCETRAGREVCGGDFEGELLRSNFGIDYLVPLVADRVRLLVQVEGARP